MTARLCLLYRMTRLVIAWIALLPFMSGTVLAAATTPQLLNINTQVVPAGSFPEIFGQVAGKIIFCASDSTSRGVYLTDGTVAGTGLLKRFPGFVYGSVISGNTAYLAADDGVTGMQLWKTDGTAAGTVQVTAFTPAPAAAYLHLWGDVRYSIAVHYAR